MLKHNVFFRGRPAPFAFLLSSKVRLIPFDFHRRLGELEMFRWPLPQTRRDEGNENCGYNGEEGLNEVLLLGLEDDEEGAGFADNPE